MLDEDSKKSILKLLQDHDESFDSINDIQPLSGGDINSVYKIMIGGNAFVVKQNYTERFPQMFEKEAKGLKLLKENSHFTIPQVYGICEAGSQSYLVMQHVSSSAQNQDFWERFGYQLVYLHRQQPENEAFGLEYDNYIGSLPQKNTWKTDWYAFYAECRILPLFEQAFNSGLFSTTERKHVDFLLNHLEENIPRESPCLIHGDLWSGNYLVGENGAPCLIDPAVYYGHRETELAFMQLFGGYSDELFEAYQQKFPIEPGFEMRKELHQLYPLLVHSVLFGGHYVEQVRGILKKWG